MSPIARDRGLDSTLALLREGYEFIWNRCRRLGSDLFITRILGKETVCIHGRDAAALFYDPSKFERQGALPRRVVTSLFGKRAFSALALHEWPQIAVRLAHEPVTAGASMYADQVMQEIRRMYPFTPYLGARVRSRFAWRGHTFEPGSPEEPYPAPPDPPAPDARQRPVR